MATYLVEYRIEVESDCVERAAQMAQGYCVNPQYSTRVWTVTSERGDVREIHLDIHGNVAMDDDSLIGLANG